MSLITDALQLQSQRKPRAIQVEVLPPFSNRKVNLRVLGWAGGLAVVVILGVWQGAEVWTFLEKAAGVQVEKASRPSAQPPVDVPPSSENPSVPVGSETAATPVAPETAVIPAPSETATAPSPSPGATASPASKSEELPLPVVIPFQTADLEDIGKAAEKLKQKRESLVRNFKIQGVRMQGKESRALIDGNPVGLGEVVGAEGIKVKAIEASRILFEDPDGTEYIKSY